MKNLTHEAVGAAATLAVCAALDSRALVAIGAVGASLLGSRLPDADQPGSRIHHRTHLERRSLGAAIAGAIGTACGYLAHLLADACTPHGAPLLGPFSVRRAHLLAPRHRIVTGGPGELMILLAATLASAALGFVVLRAE